MYPVPTAAETVANLSGRFLLTMYCNNPGWSHLHRRGLFPSKIRSTGSFDSVFWGPPQKEKTRTFFPDPANKNPGILYFTNGGYTVILYHVIPSIINGVAFTRPEAEAEAGPDAASLVESFTGGVPMASLRQQLAGRSPFLIRNTSTQSGSSHSSQLF